jgi:hypothetical protein
MCQTILVVIKYKFFFEYRVLKDKAYSLKFAHTLIIDNNNSVKC